MMYEEQIVEHIRQRYRYDAERGVLVNKRNAVIKGSKRNGYLRTNVRVDSKRHVVPLANIVWAVTHDRMPAGQIDHINGNPKDNRIENLREVTPSENCLNRLRPWKPNPSTGLPGVSKSGDRFAVEVGAKRLFFRDKFEAFHTLMLLGRMFKDN